MHGVNELCMREVAGKGRSEHHRSQSLSDPCVIVRRSWTVIESASSGGWKRSSGTYAVIGASSSMSPRSASAITAVAVIALVVEAM